MGRDDVEQGSLNSITYIEQSLYSNEEPVKSKPRKEISNGSLRDQTRMMSAKFENQ